MPDVSHKSGMLMGDGPILGHQQKTVGQLEDERETSVEEHKSRAYDDEDDGISSIEQRQEFKGVIIDTSSTNAKPQLEVSEEFAAEIHAREAKERAEREKKLKAEEEEKRKAEEKREKELKRELEEAQELDPEVIAEKLKEKNYEENQEKLYPDAKPVASDTDQRIFEKDEGTGNQIAGRAKLEFVFDQKVRRAINFAIIIDILGLIFTIAGIMVDNFSLILERVFMTIGILAMVFAIVWLTFNVRQTRHREVPSELKRRFAYATIIPGVIFRIPFVTACTAVPIIGHIVGPVIGCGFAASIHYWYLNGYDVEVSVKDSIINSVGFYAIYALILATFSAMEHATPATFIDIAIMIIGVFFGDYFAVLIAYKTRK